MAAAFESVGQAAAELADVHAVRGERLGDELRRVTVVGLDGLLERVALLRNRGTERLELARRVVQQVGPAPLEVSDLA